jgi:hypothetical protein
MMSVLQKIFGDWGFSAEIRLRDDELDELRHLTVLNWLAVLREAAPDLVDKFAETGIENYHDLSHLVDHDRIWTTMERTFPAATVATVRSFSLFDLFDRECSGYRISTRMTPYGDLGRERVNWRLVRPGYGKDLGPVHADYWFDAVMDGWDPKALDDSVKLRIWIPIFLEDGLTGFACLPGSHRKQFEFGRKPLPGGGYKPVYDPDPPLPLVTLDTPCGTAVMFNYSLVHNGVNSDFATKTRVSMETTLEIPRRQLEEACGDLSAFY